MPFYVPKYVSPKQKAEDRARLKSRLLWIAVSVPLLLMFFVFGYSDQAPAGLRSAIIALDRPLGFPIAWLISLIGPG